MGHEGPPAALLCTGLAQAGAAHVCSLWPALQDARSGGSAAAAHAGFAASTPAAGMAAHAMHNRKSAAASAAHGASVACHAGAVAARSLRQCWQANGQAVGVQMDRATCVYIYRQPVDNAMRLERSRKNVDGMNAIRWLDIWEKGELVTHLASCMAAALCKKCVPDVCCSQHVTLLQASWPTCECAKPR